MKKLLPTILLCVVFFATLFLVPRVYAQNAPEPTAAPLQSAPAALPAEGSWVKDSEVTFAGKLVARSSYFLDSLLRNYQWYYLNADSSRTSLTLFWVTVRNIVYGFFGVLVLVTAFIIVINRGRNMTFMRFIPRFIGIILLVTFSFALVQFIYQITDIVQGFFLESVRFRADKLINVHFAYDYAEFIGYRLYGAAYDESTFVSLLMVKLTAVSMYVMAGVLFIRKIILWFFILISPIFPLLMLYAPIRNTGKIWFGEFLKWLLYGPLFAIFIAGIVKVWESGIFTNLSNDANTDQLYPTATNILLGGPGQMLAINNSINGPETFLLYILSLMMLWSAVILPFVLLQIFLDYFNSYQPAESSFVKQALNLSSTLFPKTPPGPKPPSLQPAGMARALPFGKAMPLPEGAGLAKSIPISQSIPATNQVNRPALTNINRPVMTNINQPISNTTSSPVITTINKPVTTTITQPIRNTQMSQVTSTILKTSNLGVPTIRDIARIETTRITNTESSKETTEKVTNTLEKIANPRTAPTSVEREQFRVIRDQLVSEKQKGDPVAANVLTAATMISETKKEETKNASTPQATVMGENAQQAVVAHSAAKASFPVVNRVQSVSLEDYESVKKMWQENYTKLEAPKTQEGIQRDKKEWISEDVEKINEAINKLGSSDPKIQKEGMNAVSSILPFLLMGGFSQTEIIAYLKAKLEAGKSVLSDMDKKQTEEESMIDRDEGKKEHAEMVMTAEAEIPEEKKEKSSLGSE